MNERAYCAPGQKMAAQTMLAARGMNIAEVTEHPWLSPPTVLMVIAPDADEAVARLRAASSGL